MVKQSKTELGRERLLEQGVELFSEHGFHGVGLKEILGAVGIPKGSFYNYFKSKEDFGAQAARHYTEQFRAVLEPTAGDTSISGLQALTRFLDAAITLFAHKGFRHGCLLGTLGAEVSDTSELCRKAVADALANMKSEFEDTFSRGQNDGSIRRDIPPPDLADLFINGWEGALLRMKIDKSAQPLQQFRDVALPKFFGATTTPV